MTFPVKILTTHIQYRRKTLLHKCLCVIAFFPYFDVLNYFLKNNLLVIPSIFERVQSSDESNPRTDLKPTSCWKNNVLKLTRNKEELKGQSWEQPDNDTDKRV